MESGENEDGPRLCLIVAAAENGVIGRDGELPWRLPADLARFKKLTMGCPIIMGRKTYESIGRPLPGRRSIILTRQVDWSPGHEEVVVVGSLEEALRLAGDANTAFAIGGGAVYRSALRFANRVYLTRVLAEVAGDATFPPLDPQEWRRTASELHPAENQNEYPFRFETWDRATSA